MVMLIEVASPPPPGERGLVNEPARPGDKIRPGDIKALPKDSVSPAPTLAPEDMETSRAMLANEDTPELLETHLRKNSSTCMREHSISAERTLSG